MKLSESKAFKQEDGGRGNMQRIIRRLNEPDEGGLTLAYVRTATILRLPFHLCTGPILEIGDPDNERLKVWLRNRQSFPHDADINRLIDLRRTYFNTQSSADSFLTDVLILNLQPDFLPGEFEAVKRGQASAIGWASLCNPGFKLLNEIIAAHQIVRIGPYVAGLGALWPRMLTERETIERILLEVIWIVNPDYTLAQDDILTLFKDIDRLPFGLSSGATGDLRDYTSEQIEALNRAVRKIKNPCVLRT